MDAEKCLTHSLFKSKNIFFHFSDPFSAFFSTLPMKVIGLVFFNELEKLGHEHALLPYTYFLRSFFLGGGGLA